MKRRFLLFAFILSALTSLLPLPARAGPSSRRRITDFDGLPIEERAVSFAEDAKPSLEELTRLFPEELTVYLDHWKEPVSLPVTWFCVGCDYEESSYYYYQFCPAWDDTRYGLNDGMDLLSDVPYIGVFMDGLPSETDGAFLLSVTGTANESAIYDYLTQTMGLNKAAACGVLVNLYVESAFNPENLQNSYEASLGYSDASYTAAVDDGTYSNFVYDSAGYGLCQWTFWSRKEGLLHCAKEQGVSIGELQMQLAYMRSELSPALLAYLLSVPDTADGAFLSAYQFCMDFERPENPDTQAAVRGNLAVNRYWPTYNGEHVHDMVSFGAEGQCVRELQEMLNAILDALLDVDGSFGPATEAALREYQSQRGLEVDGVCGPSTWAALERDRSRTPPTPTNTPTPLPTNTPTPTNIPTSTPTNTPTPTPTNTPTPTPASVSEIAIEEESVRAAMTAANLAELKELTFSLRYSGTETRTVTVVAAFYDAAGWFTAAGVCSVEVSSGTTSVTLPMEADVSDSARLKVFLLDSDYIPLSPVGAFAVSSPS